MDPVPPSSLKKAKTEEIKKDVLNPFCDKTIFKNDKSYIWLREDTHEDWGSC